MEQAYDALVAWLCAGAAAGEANGDGNGGGGDESGANSGGRDDGKGKGMWSELHARGVQVLSLYDVLFDFCVLDAFDELARPPHAIGALLRNPWLARRFKESVRRSSLHRALLSSPILCLRLSPVPAAQ